MDIQKTGGPAFPGALARMPSGMTLRDYFAAKAMHGLMDAAMPMGEIAVEAYAMADTMIAERAK